VILAIENITGTPWDDMVSARSLAEEIASPYLQLYPDVGNLDASNKDIESELRGAAGRIVGIHVKDTLEGVIRRIPFGEGRVDFPAAFRAIDAIGYRGPLLIEMWADDNPDWENDIRHSLRWVREKIKASRKI
jgi:L-ribulose-5-phosphate 3-epimerase UlaE